MKSRTNTLIFAGILVLLLVVAFLYFFVSGRTVAKLFSEYEQYEVAITKSSSIGEIDSVVYFTFHQTVNIFCLMDGFGSQQIISYALKRIAF